MATLFKYAAPIRYIRQHVRERVHFWPFDGWSPPPNCPVVAEVYPALWSRTFPSAGRTPDRQDAFATGEWLRRGDCDGSLEKFLCLRLNRMIAREPRLRGGFSGSYSGLAQPQPKCDSFVSTNAENL